MLDNLNWQISWKQNTVPVSSLTTIYYCASVNTMQYNITLEAVVCCVNVFSVKC